MPVSLPSTRRAALAVAALLPFLALGCGGSGKGSGDSTTAQASGKKTFTIALIGKSSTNPVFLSGRTGAEAAAKELSAQHGIDVRIDWLTPPEEDATLQAQRITQAVNGGDDAVLFSASEAGRATGAINDAVD